MTMKIIKMFSCHDLMLEPLNIRIKLMLAVILGADITQWRTTNKQNKLILVLK